MKTYKLFNFDCKMDPDKYEKIMNHAIDNPYPEEVVDALKESFPDQFVYNMDTKDELQVYID